VQQTSIYAAIIYSFVVSGLLFLVFCILRPRNNRVYAPRAKHADQIHRPAPLGKGPFAWLAATRVSEASLVSTIGLDAVVFLRFLRMLRDIFLVFTVIGCGILIPVNIVGGSPIYKNYSNIATLMKFTPQYIFGDKFWAFVIVAYIWQGVVCGFLWWNYRAVLRLRRAYFASKEYQASLHSRTLLVCTVRVEFESGDILT
jgi:calcium permeable stress-gated cation channel